MDFTKKLSDDFNNQFLPDSWSSNLHFLPGIHFMDSGMEGYVQWEMHTKDSYLAGKDHEDIVLHVRISQRDSLTGFGAVHVQLPNHYS